MNQSVMTQYLFLHIRGFRAPFVACLKQRGTIRDAGNQVVPIRICVSMQNHASRLVLADAIAENLNREAVEFEAGRQAA